MPGLVAVAGGKYTTYRVMARDAIDAVARGLDRAVPAVRHPRHAAARRRRLPGAVEPARAAGRRTPALHVARIEHLLRRYGTRIDDLLAMIAERPELGEPLPGADDYLAVEVRYAVHPRGRAAPRRRARRAARGSRSRPGTAAWRRPRAPRALMAEVLGWDDATAAAEVEIYRERVAAERRSQEQPDDRAADLERTSAPDVLARR